MGYSGATTARTARENLGRALGSLQADANIPPDVMAVAQNIAQAVGALFEAERASSEPDGKASVKIALGVISQTLALLQEVRAQHPGVQLATEAIAQTLSLLFPLSNQPSRMPPPGMAPPVHVPPAASLPGGPTLRDQAPAFAQPAAPQAPRTSVPARPPGTAHQRREELEVNLGATTESNFYVGFSGEIGDGGVFAATYNIMPKGTPVLVTLTLPGGFDRKVHGWVRFVRDPMDMASESEPGMGIQFEQLDHDARELILRFIKKRPPIFFDE